jgi:hypothetical protein
MVIKKRNNTIDKLAAEDLANELADKPYGQKQDNIARATISLPTSVLFKLEDMAIKNKREKNDLRSVSAIIRECIKAYLDI